MQVNEWLEEFEQGRLLILVENEDEFNALMRYLEDNSYVRWMSGRRPTERDYSYDSPNVFLTQSGDGVQSFAMCRTSADIRGSRKSVPASKLLLEYDSKQNDSFVPLDMSQLFEE